MRAAYGDAGHGVKSTEWQYNMSVCPSVYPVVRGPFVTFVFVLISSVGVQRRDAFIFIERKSINVPKLCMLNGIF